MKIAINVCFGGFGLSAKAVKRLAELNGRTCYFFSSRSPNGILDIERHWQISLEQADTDFCFSAFDIPNPDEEIGPSFRDADGLYKTYNERYAKHSLPNGREIKRDDAQLIQVIEELGKEADGKHAELKIVEIPDGTDYIIEEYDGSEHIAEVHRTWS